MKEQWEKSYRTLFYGLVAISIAAWIGAGAYKSYEHGTFGRDLWLIVLHAGKMIGGAAIVVYVALKTGFMRWAAQNRMRLFFFNLIFWGAIAFVRAWSSDWTASFSELVVFAVSFALVYTIFVRLRRKKATVTF